MMDDLASPLERALIALNHLERALLQAPMRWLVPTIGWALISLSVLLGIALLSGLASSWFTAAGNTLHLALALAGLAIGIGFARRHAWAILLAYLSVLLLQGLPYLLHSAGVFSSAQARHGAYAMLGAEILVLLVVALLVRRA